MSTNLERMPPDLLAWLQERVVECDGCWIWQMACFNGNDPRAHRDGKTVAVRRYIYNATHQRKMRSHECAVKLPDCDDRCTHPNHVRSVLRSALLKGRPQAMKHSMAIALARRANAKIDDADVAEIRASTEPARVIARRLGIDDTYVAAIRSGKARKDYASPFAGLFTGLMASNESSARRTA